MREGAVRKTLTICVALMVAAASLPLAWGLAWASDHGTGGNTELAIAGSSGPAGVLGGPSRNTKADYRELRLGGSLPGICGLGVAAGPAGRAQLAAAWAGNIGPRDATLLALHCLLTV